MLDTCGATPGCGCQENLDCLDRCRSMPDLACASTCTNDLAVASVSIIAADCVTDCVNSCQ